MTDLYYVVAEVYQSGCPSITVASEKTSDADGKVTSATLERWRTEMLAFVKESKENNTSGWLFQNGEHKEGQIIIKFFHKLDNTVEKDPNE